MKKLLAILLTLCMLVGMAGIAEGGKVTAQVTYMGNSLADVIATWNTDEEGCAQFGVNGKVMGTVLDVLAQVGANSIVIASGEQAYEITAENLGKALYNTGNRIRKRRPTEEKGATTDGSQGRNHPDAE